MTSVDDRDVDHTYENEQSTVTIPLKEYDRLRERQKYITDRDLIGCIDKIEELVRALRKHIVRTDLEVRLVPEDSKMKDHAFYYYAMKPTKGEKKNNKLRLRKFDPVTQKHIWWVEKKLPPHSK
jgi:large subunit ribosomal protein L33